MFYLQQKKDKVTAFFFRALFSVTCSVKFVYENYIE